MAACTCPGQRETCHRITDDLRAYLQTETHLTALFWKAEPMTRTCIQSFKTCFACQGTGQRYVTFNRRAFREPCTTCNGTGTIECSAKRTGLWSSLYAFLMIC